MTKYALSEPFVAAGPSAVSIRTSLRVSEAEDAALREVGRFLGSLVGKALSSRLRLARARSIWGALRSNAT